MGRPEQRMLKVANPYQHLPQSGFWRRAVAAETGEDLSQIFQPKFHLGAQDAIATAGSCFAQHIGRALTASGCAVIDAEPAPRLLRPDQAARYGYGIYSCRYGNIYTARQFRQLLSEALSPDPPPALIWQMGDKFVDALRPGVEPEGLDSPAEVSIHRADHLRALREMLPQISLFVFTLGMTESWQDCATARTLPLCPGVIAGEFDPQTTRFENHRYPEVIADLAQIRALLQRANPQMRLLLTVSPVPLTATASGNHVLAATVYSKSTLRAAAADFAQDHDDVDYFPSFEIITSPAARSARFAPNLRSVRPEAVAEVMQIFLRAYGLPQAEATAPELAPEPACLPTTEPAYDIICEEKLLDAFSR